MRTSPPSPRTCPTIALKPTNDPRNRPLGTGVSYYELLHGIVQHDAYHGGQIAILKTILGF